MALSVTMDARAWSIGPTKMTSGVLTAVSADVGGTFTVPTLTSIEYVEVTGGIRLTAAPTISGNSVTLAFVDPSTGGYFGTVTVRGK